MTNTVPSSHPAEVAFFQQLLDAWSEAIVANSADRIDAFVDAHWRLVDTAGLIPRSRFLEVVRTGQLQHTAMTHEVLSVEQMGDVAVVVGRGTNSGFWQQEPFSADEWVTEVFIRDSDTWRCRLTTLTPRRAPT